MTRPAVFVVALRAVITIGLTSTPGFVLSRDPIANLPARFDAGWYGGIALDGYTWDHTFQRQRNIAFFPGAPAADAAGRRGARHVRGRAVARAEDAARALGRRGDFARGVLVGAVLRFATGGRSHRRRPCASGGAAACRLSVRRVTSTRRTPSRCSCSARQAPVTTFFGATGSRRPRGDCSPDCRGRTAVLLSVPLAILALQARREGEQGKAEKAGDDGAGEGRGSSRYSMRLAVAAMPGDRHAALHLLPLSTDRRRLVCVGAEPRGVGPIVRRARTDHVVRRSDSATQSLAPAHRRTIPTTRSTRLGVIFALVTDLSRLSDSSDSAWGVFVLINLLPPLLAGGLLSMGRLTSTLFPLFLALAAFVPPRAVPGWAAAFGIGQGVAAPRSSSRWRALF